MQGEILYIDCHLATMDDGGANYGLIENAALLVRAGRIAWLGELHSLPDEFRHIQAESLQQRLVTPALIDCHTHLIFAGNRAAEFEARLNGASYQEIANAGGGIMSTVLATRAASDDELLTSAVNRIDNLIAEGVAVIEIKSGYGLTIDDELRMLRLARKLETMRPIKISTTWLAAHAVPPEYEGRADTYIDEVAIPGLEQAAKEGLVDAVDGFCETIAFSRSQLERLFIVAKTLGLPIKLHAEQLSDQQGALLAAKYNCLSADHLEYLPSDDVTRFAESGAVAVMLPGAFYTLNETQRPPIEYFRENKVAMAVATDCNPGSSPISSILTAMNMACTQFSMTPVEALAGTTRHAAKALGLQGEFGELKVGASANLAIWNLDQPAQLSYWLGGSALYKRVFSRESV